MNPHIQKALQYINNANYAGYFEEMNKVDIPKEFEATYAAHKGVFIAGQAPYNFHTQLMAFCEEVNRIITQQKNTSSMHGIEQEIKGLEKVVNLLLEKKIFLEEEWGSSTGKAKFGLQKDIQKTKEEIGDYRKQVQVLKNANPNNEILNNLDEKMQKAEKDIDTMQSNNSVSNNSTITGNGNTLIQGNNNSPVNINIGSSNQKAKQKILFLAANPLETARLQLDKEYRIIKERLHRNTHYDFLNPEFALTVDNLIQVMNQKPSIVHFAGHGEKEGIMLADANNEPVLMSERPLKRLFKQHHEDIKLVVLNSCYSLTQAELISKFGIYVIGIENKLKDDLALRFSAGLYIGLSEGKSIEQAYDDAMIILETEYPNLDNYPAIWKDGKKLDI